MVPSDPQQLLDRIAEDPAGTLAIMRLYHIVQGRSPDPDGLADHHAQLLAGRPLLDIAAAFLASEEFAVRAGGRPASALSLLVTDDDAAQHPQPSPAECRISLGPPAAQASDAAVVATALAQRSGVQRGDLAALATLFPAGIGLEDQQAYQAWRRIVATMQFTPPPLSATPVVVSWIMALDQPDVALLKESLHSLIDQRGGWEAIVVWSAPPAPAVLQLLSVLRHRHPQLRLMRAHAGGLPPVEAAAASARGTFIVRLGQHDRADPAATACVSACGDARIVLADGDRIGADGAPCDPCLQGGWDPDGAGWQPRGLIAVRRDPLPIRTGPNPLRRDGSGEVPERRVVTLARILCHRHGTGPGPVFGIAAPAAARICPAACIVIPTRDRADLLAICVDSILARTEGAFEILIVDNDSREASTAALLARLCADTRVRVIPAAGPFNWSGMNNLAMRHTGAQVAVFLNNDTEVLDGSWLAALVGQAMRPEVGAAGARLLYPDGTIQHAGIVLGPQGRSTHVARGLPGDDPGYLGQLRHLRRVSAVTGACLATRADVFAAVGGFDAEALPITWSDVDYCLRVQALGLHVVWTPLASLVHHEQATRGADDTPAHAARLDREQALMRARWGDRLERDPYCSPHLVPSEGAPRLGFGGIGLAQA